MEKRIAAFLALSFVLMAANMWLMNRMNPQPQGGVAQRADAPGDGADAPNGGDGAAIGEKDRVQEGQGDKPSAAPDDPTDAIPGAAQPPAAPAPRPVVPDEWITLGSVDPQSPFRMLVTLTNRGAAVERIELNSDRYHDLGDATRDQGYLGHLVPDDAPNVAGCVLHVVGPGTPAEEAGLLSGDVVVAVGNTTIASAEEFDRALAATKPGDDLEIHFERNGRQLTAQAKLRYRTLELVRPEGNDALAPHAPPSAPRSFLMTLDRLDDREVLDGEDELQGFDLRTANWEVLPRANNEEVTFSYLVPGTNLEVIKRFRLVPSGASDGESSGYHLDFDVELKNHDDKPHSVAYRLDGPIGMPTEGWWYSNKISPNWMDAAGARDVIVGFLREGYPRHSLISC